MSTKQYGAVIAVLLIGLGFSACSKKTASSNTTAVAHHQTLYHCAMHPQIVSDKPDECPICHMRMTPVDEEGLSSDTAQHKVLYYRNPMNPSATSPVPMKDAMGMDYIPVYSDQTSAVPVPGQAAVHLAPGLEQRIGVTIATAMVRDLDVPIRAAARVAYDPQLYSATIEHQEAIEFLRKAENQRSSDLVEQARATVHSSELRLRQMGLSDEQIVDIEKPDYNPSNLLLGSKESHAWVYANVYDYEATLIHPGQAVELTSPALPGVIYDGTVRAIDTILNSDTRTLRVRIEVPNPRGELRPETFLSAAIHAALGRRLTVPESAVVDTGTRQLVYVQTQPGVYEPREVRLGRRAGGYYEIVSGLKAGEQVSASSNFLLDSESRIQASAQEAAQHLSQ